MASDDPDPQVPFIGSDGVEYACVADKILGRPRQSYFNAQIGRYRENNDAAKEAWFRRKYLAFRQSPKYDDKEVEGEVHHLVGTLNAGISYAYHAGKFHAWTDSPDDDTPITPRPSARSLVFGLDTPDLPF